LVLLFECCRDRGFKDQVDKGKALHLIDETKQLSAMLAALIKIRKGVVYECPAEYQPKED